MGAIGNTEADVFIPEIWKPGFLKALYAAGVVRQRVLSCDADVANRGDIVWVRIAPDLTVSDVTGATGAVTEQSLTPTAPFVTVDQWRETSFTVLDKAAKQADDYLQPCLEQGVPALKGCPQRRGVCTPRIACDVIHGGRTGRQQRRRHAVARPHECVAAAIIVIVIVIAIVIVIVVGTDSDPHMSR
jgi:hypothetical protein